MGRVNAETVVFYKLVIGAWTPINIFLCWTAHLLKEQEVFLTSLQWVRKSLQLLTLIPKSLSRCIELATVFTITISIFGQMKGLLYKKNLTDLISLKCSVTDLFLSIEIVALDFVTDNYAAKLCYRTISEGFRFENLFHKIHFPRSFQ